MKLSDLQISSRSRTLSLVFAVAIALLFAVSAVSAQGKKYAMLVGINEYQGRISKLSGTVNDVKKLNDTLTSNFGFVPGNITVLTDSAATREGILSRLKEYEATVNRGDLFVFHYSGHGVLWPDNRSDFLDETELIFMEEENDDGEMEVVYARGTYDSAIVPVDSHIKTSDRRWGNLILDDELYEIFGDFTRKGAKVLFLSDSCHSGSVGRANANKDSKRKMTTLASVNGVRRFSDIVFQGDMTTKSTSILPPEKGLYITMSGSRDNEYSLDLKVNGIWGGLFTNTLIKNLSGPNAGKLTYRQLADKVSAEVATEARTLGSDQNPVLDTTFGNPMAAVFSMPTTGTSRSSAGNGFADDLWIKSRSGTGKIDADINIKRRELPNDANANLERRGQTACGLTVYNNTPWATNVYFNGAWGGMLAPWSTYRYFLDPGPTTAYGRADFPDGTYRYWTATYACGGLGEYWFRLAP